MDKMKQIKELEAELKRLKKEALAEKRTQDEIEPTRGFAHNKQTVLDFIGYIQKNYREFGYYYELDMDEILDRKTPYILGSWTLTLNHVQGGYEGAGDEYYRVVVLNNVNDFATSHWLIPGWYSSYNGSELELCGIYQVEPFEKVVIDYRKVES